MMIEDVNVTTPVQDMTLEQLRDEVQYWRRIWDFLDDDIKYYLTQIGVLTRVVTRFSKAYLGALYSVHFDVSEVELLVDMSEYDMKSSKYFRESKVMRFPVSNLTQFEFISARELEAEEESASNLTSLETASKVLNP